MIGIYKITSPSSKIYIGQSTNWVKRFKYYEKLECKGQSKLYNSLQKYGFENHIFEIIEECSEELLNEREIYWIQYYNSINEGLNIKEGGIGGKWNDEMKQKLSNKLKNRDISVWKHKIYTKKRNDKIGIKNKNKIISEETKQKISKNSTGVSRNKGRIQSNEEKQKRSNIRKGYKPTQNHIDNMKQGMLGKNTKKIICIDNNTTYSSIREASKILGIKERCISNNLLGLSKKTHNLTFKYI